MRLSNNHIDYMAFLIYKALKDHPNVDVKNPDVIVSTARMRIKENLRVEEEIREEAERKLEPHKAEIIRTGADYQSMLRNGMKQLAKDRGFVL